MQHILNWLNSMSSRGLVRAVTCVLLVLAATPVAFGQHGLIADNLPAGDKEDLQPSISEAAFDRSRETTCCDSGCRLPCCPSRWTASADFVIFDRIGSVLYPLVETVPHGVPLRALSNTPGTEMLNANDFQQGFSSGWKFDLMRHGDNNFDLELSYFQIDGWNDYRSIGPTPNDWLVMRGPGGFLQTQDSQNTQRMAWDYASRLYNAELNVRWNALPRLTLLAGFRWVNLSEELQGTLPPERSVPFWDTKVNNNLYGFQIGGDGKLFERGRLSMNGTIKAGIFGNNAEETTAVSIYRTVFSKSASTNHVAFLGEAGLQCKYQITQRLSLKLGYEVMWLEGVALAPGQIQETYSNIDPRHASVHALGVNCGSGVFFHGANAGLQFSF